MLHRMRVGGVGTALALLVSIPTARGDAAIGLFNPFVHGLIPWDDFEPINELTTGRVDIVHELMLADFNTEDTDYVNFAPYYLNPSTRAYADRYWHRENYPAYERETVAGYSDYRNLHVMPDRREQGLGTIRNYAYFNRMELISSNTPGSGLAANGGSVTLTSPNLDTGFGAAYGEISPEGDIRLRVDVNRSGIGFGETPVAEAAIQATYTDTIVINGAGQESVSANLSFGARAIAPVLDFSRGDFFNYAIGYNAAIFERSTVYSGSSQFSSIHEYWSTSGFYWMDARAQFEFGTFGGLPISARIESLGLAVPDMPGVEESRVLLSQLEMLDENDDVVVLDFYKDIREVPLDGTTVGGLLYDDPLMPFDQYTLSEGVMLPTDRPLELVVNFFVVAGGSDSFLGRPLDFGIDGSHTASFGLDIDDPGVTYSSASGFGFRQTALAVPEVPVPTLILCAGLATLARHCRGRSVGHGGRSRGRFGKRGG